MKLKNIYYSLGPILKRDKDINIISGVRGNGKTFRLKKRVLRQFFIHEKQSVWIRRYKNQSVQAALSWLNDMGDVIKKLKIEVELMVNSKQLFYKDEDKKKVVICTFIPLTGQGNYKSVSFHNVSTIVYDEFLHFSFYGKYEITQLKELLSTVQRDRLNVKLFMLSNNVSKDNPYFEELGINKLNQGITVTQNYAIEICDAHTVMLAERYKQTIAFKFGKPGNEYNKYSMEGKFLMDNADLVGTLKGNKQFKFNIECDKTTIGVWKNKKIIYFSKSHNSSGKIYNIFKKDLNNNIIITPNNSSLGIGWIDKIYKKELLFETQHIKQLIIEFLKLHVK